MVSPMAPSGYVAKHLPIKKASEKVAIMNPKAAARWRGASISARKAREGVMLDTAPVSTCGRRGRKGERGEVKQPPWCPIGPPVGAGRTSGMTFGRPSGMTPGMTFDRPSGMTSGMTSAVR